MATDVLNSSVQSQSETDDQGFSQPSGAALLLIIGEPISEDHKTLILEQVTKGFRCWDVESTGIDINDELAQIANRADLGEEGPNATTKGGERIIRHRSDKLAVEILVSPQAQTVRKSLKSFLTVSAPLKCLIHAGHVFQGSGAWVLQDDVFTFGNFAHVFKDSDVENALKQQQGGSLIFYSQANGDWSNSIAKQEFSKVLKVKVNPEEKLHNVHGVLQFTAYIGSFVKSQNVTKMLHSSDVVGNIRFSKPTLYIFPGCQGDSTLFGVNGFSLLVNGGYNRRACFWDFTRHLDRIDAVLLTHLGTDNLFGIGAMLQRKSLDNVHPEIGFMYLNSSEKTRHSPASSVENVNQKEPSLLINLAEEGNRIIEFSKQLGHFPHPCSRAVSSQHQEPVNLYHKVGQGSLDMYILNPVQDSKELKEFYQQWNKQVSNFGVHQQVPLPNMLSICAMLVWKPASPTEKITRIFFPGNAPQNKIVEGLERIKHLDFLKHPYCCSKDLAHANKKPSANSAKNSARTTLRTVAPVKSESPRKTEVRHERAKPAAPKANKIVKEDTNKKAAKSKETKDEKEKSDKAKSSTSSSPSKSSVTAASPVKSLTPTDVPAEPVIPQELIMPEPATNLQSPGNNLIDITPTEPPLVNHVNEQPFLPEETKPEADQTPSIQPEQIEALQSQERASASPEPLPDPAQFDPGTYESVPQESVPVENQPPISEKQRLADLGIYDEDDDSAEDGTAPAEESVVDHVPAKSLESPVHTPEYLEEEEQPQSLPDPVAVPDQVPFTQDPDLIPETVTQKETSPEIDEKIQTEASVAEPDILPAKEESPAPQYSDPAEEIPSSPEATDDHPEFSYPTDQAVTKEPAPSFTQEPDVVPSMQGQQAPIEQNIQYGITDDNARHMGGIREEDEDTCEPEVGTMNGDVAAEAQEDQLSDEHKDHVSDAQDHASDIQEDHASDTQEDRASGTQEDRASGTQEDRASGTQEDRALDTQEDHASDTQEDHATSDTQEDHATSDTQEDHASDTQEDHASDTQEDHASDIQDDASDIQDHAAEAQDHIPEAQQDRIPEAQQDRVSEAQENRTSMAHEEMIPEPEEENVPVPEEKIVADIQKEVNQEAQAGAIVDSSKLDKQTMEDLGIYDEDEEDEGVQDTAEERDPGAYVYEKEVDLEDEEGPQADDPIGEFQRDEEQEEVKSNDVPECHDMRQDEGQEEGIGMEEDEDHVPQTDAYQAAESEQDALQYEGSGQELDSEHQEVSNIPEAFEKDETPTPGESGSVGEHPAGDPSSTATDSALASEILEREGELLDQRDDTDSIDGGTPDDDKDIDESFAREAAQDDTFEGATAQSLPEDIDPPANMRQHSESTNPFDNLENQGYNPFLGIDQSGSSQEVQEMHGSTNPFDENLHINTEQNQQASGFDPLSEWGQPMGLPSPPPLEDTKSAAATNGVNGKTAKTTKNGTTKSTDVKKADPKKTSPSRSKPPEKRPTSAASKTTSRATTNGPVTNKSTDIKTRTTRSPATNDKKPEPKKPSAASTEKKAPTRTRPATAPLRIDPAKSDLKTRTTTTTRRPATATSRSSPVASKGPPLPPMTPFYVDLTYIPNHGDPAYSDVEFFKRIRARYYVLSALSPNPQILNSLLDAKQTWEDKELEVTVIPTYDNETLRHWMGLHKEQLGQLKIDVAPSASRCTIQLQDHETSCSAFRLEF